MSIYECIRLTGALGDLINRRASQAELLEQAVKDGYRFMREYGVRKIMQGLTTVEEVMAVTVAESER